jgi:DNA-binding response OmpR family regulator
MPPVAATIGAMTTKLLLVGGAELRAALAELFANEPAYAYRGVETPQEALSLVHDDPPDALLVGDELSAEDVAALLRAARASGFEGAAILLARASRTVLRDVDARLSRPFRFAELLATMRKAREERIAREAARALGKRDFCAATQTLAGPDGARQPLTEKEIAILLRLARARGEVVARDVLLRDVWGYNASIVTHTLETHIHRLRRKIEGASGEPKLLVTAQGGYRLTTADDVPT